jgi:ribosome-associated protein|tara:strand:- start:766 stop:1104 length:339 start_codon:yes stop_codon:yes gene_type:complete
MKLPELKLICLDALDDMKAKDILSLDIRDISNFADWFIIATASSSRNAKAISNKIIEEVKLNKLHVIGVEGQEDSEWVLIDCGDIVVNVMQQEAREFYDLESLWGEATLISA